MTKRKTPLFDQLLDSGSDAEITPELLSLETALSALHGDNTQAPSDASWDKIVARIDSDAAAPGTETVPPEEGVWEKLAPGIERKVVRIDRSAGLQSYFIRMDAGAVFPIHEHDADEHCVVLEGTLEIGDALHGPGTFHLARKGHRHVPITARSDALFFIRGAL